MSEQTKTFDVALSFAGEDRNYVRAVAEYLAKRSVKVFFDEFLEADIVGRNLIDHLSDIYQNRARLCVMFVSSAYAAKPFPNLERRSAQATALFTADHPYILPVRLDDTPLPGLLPTVAFARGKTPEALGHLIVAKLRLTEPKGYRDEEDRRRQSDAIMVRFDHHFELDVLTLKDSLESHKHRFSISNLPIEIRFPTNLLTAINDAQEFRNSNEWHSLKIGDDARTQFSKLYDVSVPRWKAKTVEGLRVLIHEYGKDRLERLLGVCRDYMASRIISLYRVLSSYRLVGMKPFEWEDLFPEFSYQYNEDDIMCGLAFVRFLSGDERFIWVDADAYIEGDQQPLRRRRLYIPSRMYVSSERGLEVTEADFDKYFALQFLDREPVDNREFVSLNYLLNAFVNLKLLTRGEWAWECAHFANHSTHNFNGEPLYPLVANLRGAILKDFSSAENGATKQELCLWRVSRMFSRAKSLENILFGRPIEEE